MKHGHRFGCATALVLILLPTAGYSQTATVDAMTVPAIKSFIGDGLGARNPKASAEIDQFGQLVGVWRVEAELRGLDGKWMKSSPGL